MRASGYLKVQSRVTERQGYALRKGGRSGARAVTKCTHTDLGAQPTTPHTGPTRDGPLLPGPGPVQHVTAWSTAGNCKMLLSTVICVSKLT